MINTDQHNTGEALEEVLGNKVKPVNLKEITLNSSEGLMLKQLNTGHLMQRAGAAERPHGEQRETAESASQLKT